MLGYRVQGEGRPGNLLVPSRKHGEYLLNQMPSAALSPNDSSMLILNNFYIRAGYENRMELLGEEIVRLARQFAPKYTGDLARTIRANVNPATLDLTVRVGGLPAVVRGGRVWYAQAIETGVIRVKSGHQHYLQLAISTILRTPIETAPAAHMRGRTTQRGTRLGEATWPQNRVMAQFPDQGRPPLHLRSRGMKSGSEVKLRLLVHDPEVPLPKSARRRYKLADRVPYDPELGRAHARGVEAFWAAGAPVDMTPTYKMVGGKRVRRDPDLSRRGVRPLESEAIWMPSSAPSPRVFDEPRVEGHMPGFGTAITRRAPSTSPHKAAVGTARRRAALLSAREYNPPQHVMDRINEQRSIFGDKPLTAGQISAQYRKRATEAFDPYGQFRYWRQDPFDVYRDIHRREALIARPKVSGRQVGRLRRKTAPLDSIGPKGLAEQARVRERGLEILEGSVPVSRTRSWRSNIKNLKFTEMAREPEWIQDLYQWAVQERPDLFE